MTIYIYIYLGLDCAEVLTAFKPTPVPYAVAYYTDVDRTKKINILPLRADVYSLYSFSPPQIMMAVLCRFYAVGERFCNTQYYNNTHPQSPARQ